MMNETLALFSYGWTRYQRTAKIVFAFTIASLALTGIAWLLNFSEFIVRSIFACGTLGLFGCFLLPLGLFSMSHKSSMLNEISGYDTWLLRLPIPSWKLAVIPVLLVTAWSAVLWGFIAVPARLWGNVPMPIFSQILAMSSGAILTFSLIWKPQRYIWLRGLAFLIVIPFVYITSIGCIGVALEAPEFMPWVVVASLIFYAASVAFAIYSVKLARISKFQQSQAVKSLFFSRPERVFTSIDFKSRVSALAWHDARRALPNQLQMSLVIVPMILFCACALPLAGATAIFGLVITAAMCCVCAASQVEPTVMGDRSSLPSYLVASPLGSREIAYSRLKTVSIAFVCLFLLMSLTLLLSLFWKSNLATAERWWASTEAALSTTAPVRMILFTHVVMLVVSLGILLRFIGVQLYGRQNVVHWLIGGILLAVVPTFIVALRWFLKQTNWEEVTLVTSIWLNWSYNLIYIALAIKLSLDLAVILSVGRRFISQQELIQFVVGWSALVIAAAVTAWMVWPVADSFTLTTALMASAIVIPLSPFLFAPAAVDANRHRSIPIGSVVRMDC